MSSAGIINFIIIIIYRRHTLLLSPAIYINAATLGKNKLLKNKFFLSIQKISLYDKKYNFVQGTLIAQSFKLYIVTI